MEDYEQGLYPVMTDEEYFSLPYPGSSQIKAAINRSLAHSNTPGKGSTAAMNLGIAAHHRLLENDYENTVSVGPKVSSISTKAWKEFAEKNAGKTLIKPQESEIIEAMYKRIREHSVARTLLFEGEPEVAAIWDEPEFGMRGKAKLDKLLRPSHRIVDLKTAQDASPKGFKKAIVNFGYHLQAAWYSRGYRMITGKQPEFIFVVIEKEEPFGIGVYQLTPSDIQQAELQIVHMLPDYGDALKYKFWAGYPEMIQTIELPAYAW